MNSLTHLLVEVEYVKVVEVIDLRKHVNMMLGIASLRHVQHLKARVVEAAEQDEGVLIA